MRALGVIPLSLVLAMLFAGAVHAQTTQEIRRSPAAATSSSSNSHAASPSIARVVGSLLVVLGLVALLYWAARRFLPRSAFAPSSPRETVHVLSRTSISPKQRVLLIQVGRRVLVVGDNGSSLNALCEITDPDEVASLLDPDEEAPATQSRPPVEVESLRREIDGLVHRVRGMARQIEQT